MNNKLESMLEANKITHRILASCKKLILNSDKPIATTEVSKYAQFGLNRLEVDSAFKNVNGFSDIMCISLNDAVIHGLPDEDLFINKGDIVSLDFGVRINGYCSDAAISFVNENRKIPILNKKHKLVKATKQALDDAVKALNKSYPNCKISDITKAINKYEENYGIVLDYGGHGIGKELHETNIFIPNSWNNFHKDRDLKIGDYFTIEPMLTLGSGETFIADDGFTIKTLDKSLSAHFEYSIAITEDGVLILK